MKRDAKSKPNDNQNIMHARLKENGQTVVIGYGADDAIRKLEAIECEQ